MDPIRRSKTAVILAGILGAASALGGGTFASEGAMPRAMRAEHRSKKRRNPEVEDAAQRKRERKAAKLAYNHGVAEALKHPVLHDALAAIAAERANADAQG